MSESFEPWHISERGAREFSSVHKLGQGVRIALLDTGVELSHPELKSQHIECIDVTTRSGVGVDKSGHGTSMASVLVGRHLGIAPRAELVSIKIACGRRPATEANILSALDECDKLGVDLIHLAYGSTRHHPKVRDALQSFAARGVLTVAAAGKNRLGYRLYPGAYSSVLGVGSLRRDKTEFQQAPCPNTRVVEFGHNVYTAWIDGGYKLVSGSSIASAIASGVVSLWLAGGGAGGKRDRLLGCSQLDWLLCTAKRYELGDTTSVSMLEIGSLFHMAKVGA